jgi:hypothetical protein
VTPAAITASRNSARASGPHDLAELRGTAGSAAKASPAWTRTSPPRKTSPGAALHGRRRNCARRRQPREQGADRCPAPTPQTETMTITQGQLPHNAESRL